jgi:hypothetical protein
LIEQDTRDYALFGDHYWNLATKKNEGNYIRGEFAMEKAFGFSDIWDLLHAAAFCSIYEKKFIFEYDLLDADGNPIKDESENTIKLEYRFENWTGLYGIGAVVGGECGLYVRPIVYDTDGNPVTFYAFCPYKNSGNITRFYTNYMTVLPPQELPTTTYVYKRDDPDNPIVVSDTRDYAINDDDWWNYAVASNLFTNYSKEDLGYKVEYEIRDSRLADAFMEAASSDPDVTVSCVGDIITVDWVPSE